MDDFKYKVRPSSRADSRDAFRIYLSPAQLLLHKFHAGDVCHIGTPEGSPRPAIVWPATEKIKDDVVQISKVLQALYGLKLESRISIERGDVAIIEADEITLSEICQSESKISPPSLDENERSCWAWLLKKNYLCKAEIVTPGMIFDRVEAGDEKRSYHVLRINYSTEPRLYRAGPSCTVYLNGGEPHREYLKAHGFEGDKTFLTVSSEGVGGLERQIGRLNDEIFSYSASYENNTKLPFSYQLWRGSILLHGAQGTGKSMLLRKICEAGWRRVFHIEDNFSTYRLGGNEAAIHQVFSDALGCQPSVIIIDNLESIAGRQGRTDSVRSVNVGKILSRQLDRLDSTQTLAVGATRNLTDIDQDLRSAGRLELDIEVPIPDLKSRAEILKVLCRLRKDEIHGTLERVAARTHGFVGADLDKLLRRAVKTIHAQDRAFGTTCEGFNCRPTEPKACLESMEDAFSSALQQIRPTAIQEIFVETPFIKWTDIGGQHEVKKRLEQAVVWPFKVDPCCTVALFHPESLMVSQYADEVKQFGLKPKKGLLLYGPPGCSKTMTARAVATESGLNLIAVKGAELLSMYVGESERAVREIFGKARAASPCIIFFDEIDAVGAARDKSQQGSPHTVTTLLNELDGFEELKGVFVLAATNKPEILDPALIRAGRLSETLYVGLPDLDARREILQMQMRFMSLSNDVELMALSEACEGFSGAEIVSICEQASYAAFEERIQSNEDCQISQRHFSVALAKVERSVTPEMTRNYELWGIGRQRRR